MTKTPPPIETFATQMEAILRKQCGSKGVDFATLRDQLLTKWQPAGTCASPAVAGGVQVAQPTPHTGTYSAMDAYPPVSDEPGVPVSPDTFTARLEAVLTKKCADANVPYFAFQKAYVMLVRTPRYSVNEEWLERYRLRNPEPELAAFTQELATFLQEQCLARNVAFEDFWFSFFFRVHGAVTGEQKEKTRGLPLLEKAYVRRENKDTEGYKAACLEWLKYAHGVEIGDTVQVHSEQVGPMRAVLEAVEVELNHKTLAYSRLKLYGRFEGSTVTEHEQYVGDPVTVVAKR